ncbi:hypothetical protein BH23GEM3_BH23GEM3_18090 [soil metagenome]
MESLSLEEKNRAELRETLEAISGVRRALVDGPPWTVFLVCEAAATLPEPVEARARAAMEIAGLHGLDVQLHVSYLSAPEPRRRVAFVGAHLSYPQVGHARAQVSLEWQDRVVAGEAEGASGPAADLRLCALAAVRALEQVLPDTPVAQLVGVKSVRVFDHDLVIVLLRSATNSNQPVVGACLDTSGPARSASLAVLNATNRVLGNYLVVGD